MPPPQMTTSAVSKLCQAPELEDELQRRQRGDVAVVEGRRDLDDIQTDERRCRRDRVEDLQRLARRESARRGNLGTRREGGVERVDVERDVHPAAGEPVPDPLQRSRRGGMKVAGA